MAAKTQLLHAVLTARDLSPALRDLDAPARHLYASLICHAQPTPAGLEAAVTVSDLCMATGLSDRTVRRHLQTLEDAGLLNCIREAGKPSRYCILYPGHPDPGYDDTGHHTRGRSDHAHHDLGQSDTGHHDPDPSIHALSDRGLSDTSVTYVSNKQDSPAAMTGESCRRDRGSTLPPEPPFPTRDTNRPAHPDYDIDDDNMQDRNACRARSEATGHGDSPAPHNQPVPPRDDALARLVEAIRPHVRSYPGARDLEEMDRWLRLAAGDLSLILQAIADGLRIFQRDNPGDLPRCARFYSGFVEKAVAWASARRRRHLTLASTRPATQRPPRSRSLPTNRSTVRGVPREVDAGYERYARVLGAPIATGPRHGRPTGTVRGVPREVDDHYVRYARVLG